MDETTRNTKKFLNLIYIYLHCVHLIHIFKSIKTVMYLVIVGPCVQTRDLQV